MSIGAFTEKENKPDLSEALNILTSRRAFWEILVEHMINCLKAKPEWKFYGKNFGWALRFKKNGKSLAALYPSQNKLTIQIILDRNQVDKALELVKSVEVKDIITKTEEICEGKWIYIQIEDETILEEIKKLIDIRGGL